MKLRPFTTSIILKLAWRLALLIIVGWQLLLYHEHMRFLRPQCDAAFSRVKECMQRDSEFRSANQRPWNDDQRMQYGKLSNDTTTALREETRIVGVLTQRNPARLAPWVILALALPYVWDLRGKWQRFRRENRLRQGRCGNCGYDLRAARDRCPECGTKTTEPVSAG